MAMEWGASHVSMQAAERFCGNTPMSGAPYPRHQFMKGWFILLSMRVLSTASMQKRESYIGRMILLVEYGVPL